MATRKDNTFLSLQVAQHYHDINYHRDIMALPLHARLNHMALHFAKYTGKIAATENTDELLPVFTDMLIIAMSTANTLGVSLTKELHYGKAFDGDLEALGKQYIKAFYWGKGALDHASILKEAAYISGAICGACEKIDHLEDVSFRAVIRGGVVGLFTLAVVYLTAHNTDPAASIRDRHAVIEGKARFFSAFEAA